MISRRTGEMRAIELDELPNEIPIAKRSASAETPLAASPILFDYRERRFGYHKEKGIRDTMDGESRGK